MKKVFLFLKNLFVKKQKEKEETYTIEECKIAIKKAKVAEKRPLKYVLNDVVVALTDNTILYKWAKPHSCNCGIVVQSLLSLTARELGGALAFQNTINKHKFFDPTWTNKIHYYCPISGKPIDELFQILYEKGFTGKDMVHLEYLSNKEILRRTNINTLEENYYAKKTNLIKYLQAWIEILEETEMTSTTILLEKALIDQE